MPQDYEPYNNVPTYDIANDYADPGLASAKCFVVDRVMVYGVSVAAVMDRGGVRKLTINGFDIRG